MAQGIISKKYLIDIANAIRIMLDTDSTYTPSEMTSAIALITGNESGGELVKSSNADVGVITDTLMGGICDALRTALDTQDTFTPSQIADAIMTISSGSVDIVPWSTGTDEQIVAMIQAAHNGYIDLQQDGGWAVGDARTISIGAFTTGDNVSEPAQNVDIVLTSFDDYNNCGCVVQFDFLSSLSQKSNVNTSSVGSTNGYGGSIMKTTTLPALVEALPVWLKELLIEFSCLAASKSGPDATIVSVAGNKLALRSEVEVYNNNTYSLAGEGTYIPYYNSSARRTKKLGKSGSNGYWYLRSPMKSSSQMNGYFRYVGADGGQYSYGNIGASGIAPFGCL